MKATVSGKAKERWARRSSANSALSWTCSNSSVVGSWRSAFEGVVSRWPRCLLALRTCGY
ncbi:hypothetical protein N7U49_11985 [Streptomyces sp. AD2-2]|nr:hypothetical protein N7U49_11985 [Streptomyces sp. AD2-2]